MNIQLACLYVHPASRSVDTRGDPRKIRQVLTDAANAVQPCQLIFVILGDDKGLYRNDVLNVCDMELGVLSKKMTVGVLRKALDSSGATFFNILYELNAKLGRVIHSPPKVKPRELRLNQVSHNQCPTDRVYTACIP